MSETAFERIALKDFTEKAYLDYSMYVILDRALPNIADGLKPVQRRIIYAMSDLGLGPTAKFKKSAATVGDVIGNYHPHGDQACYEAMVLMAQPFSYRYPLVDGQGNWGSQDNPKSFAAYRYTESKLTAYAQTLLSELGQGTVDWVPNYSGERNEPALLPARLPNLLLNGATGIAVGMATDIPPHNLREVVDACILLLERPEATLEEVCELVKGPDFTTEAEIITPREDILRMYRTGNGSVRARARWELEDGNVVITALPQQVSGESVQQQIAEQMQAKKLPMLEDIRDESDHENPTRIVLIPKGRRVDAEPLMSHLFATTDLERSYRVNLNIIGLNGKPQVKNLVEILREWLSYRTETVRRRLQYRLDKVNARLHILAGYLIAFLNIDEVIAIIRREDEPKPVLMARFELSDTQAEAILELKLRHLAKLEEMKIRGEQAELEEERKSLEATLGSAELLRDLIKKELREDAERHGDARRAPIVSRQASQALDITQVIPNEPMTVILSEKGWVRAAKGHDIDAAGLTYRAGDAFLCAANGRSNQSACLLDSTGRSYAVPIHELPSARGQGEPLTGRLSPPAGATFPCVLTGADSDWLVLASDAGYGFVTQVQELFTRNRTGKTVLTVPEHAKVLSPLAAKSPDHDLLAVISAQGRMLVFPLKDLPVMSRGKGNKLIQIDSGELAQRQDFVVAMACLADADGLRLHCGKRNLTLSRADLSGYQGARGWRGGPLPRGFQRVDRVEVVSK